MNLSDNLKDNELENKKEISGGGSVLKGAAVIGIAGIVVKILGAVFRIPLSNWMGDLGMSYYQVAYNIYMALIVMSTAGFPVAISKLVSENLARGNYENAHKVFKVALKIMAVLGGASAAICFFGADALAVSVGNPDAAWAVRAIAPALLFVPILSSFRGFFQGRQNMNPTALSEIIEQLFRVAFGFSLTIILLPKSLPFAAGGASFGASAGSLAAVAFMTLVYFLHRARLQKEIQLSRGELEDTKTIIKKIFVIAVPIIIGAEIIPLMFSLDMGIVMNRLQDTGWSEEESRKLYGMMGAYCNSLINMPEFLIQAIAISMVPAISRAATKGNTEDVSSSISTGYKLTTLISFPCMVGLIVLSKPIFRLLYPLKVDEALQAIPVFILLCAGIVTLALYETSTGTLQAVGKQVIPVRNVAIGAGIKIVLTYILVGIHSINVKGAAISSTIAFLVAFALNELAVKKYTGAKINLVQVYIKPAIASVVMGVFAFFSHKLISGIIGSNLATVVAILVGVIVYAIMVVAIKVATPDDIREMPKGDKINSLIYKFYKGWK